MIMKLVVDFSSFTFDKKDQEKENLWKDQLVHQTKG
jgi:hypothetical protein